MTRRTITAVRILMKPYGITWSPRGWRYGVLPIYPQSVVDRLDKDERGRVLAGWVVFHLDDKEPGARIKPANLGVLRWRKQGDTRLVYDLIWEPASGLFNRPTTIPNWQSPAVIHGAMDYHYGEWRQSTVEPT